MSQSIVVDDLSLEFTIPKKEPGLRGAVKSFFSREYKKLRAVDNVSFSIGPGELIGFIGPNGAGKTTTLKMLSGLLAPTFGGVSVLGFTPFERKKEFLQNVSLIMGQKNQLIWDLPATDTFLLNKAIYNIPEAQYQKVYSGLVELLEVSEQLSTPVRKLSLGQRMKMELIAALLHTPKVLFLDEPTIGLDVVVQRNLRDFIRDYNRTYESTILLTSHYMGDVQELCSRVIVIAGGKIIFDGKLDTLIQKHSPYKIIRVAFEQEPQRSELEKIGEIRDWEPPRVALRVPRETAPQLAAKMLEKYEVSDLNIEETPIEDVIRALFHG